MNVADIIRSEHYRGIITRKSVSEIYSKESTCRNRITVLIIHICEGIYLYCCDTKK